MWDKSLTSVNIKAGFAATVIFPFNPEAISELAYVPNEVTQIRHEAAEPIGEPTHQSTIPKGGQSNISRSTSSSSDDDSSEGDSTREFLDTSDSDRDLNLSNEFLHKSLTEMLQTPDKIVKSVKNVRQKTVSNRALVVKRDVFNEIRDSYILGFVNTQSYRNI